MQHWGQNNIIKHKTLSVYTHRHSLKELLKDLFQQEEMWIKKKGMGQRKQSIYASYQWKTSDIAIVVELYHPQKCQMPLSSIVLIFIPHTSYLNILLLITKGENLYSSTDRKNWGQGQADRNIKWPENINYRQKKMHQRNKKILQRDSYKNMVGGGW